MADDRLSVSAQQSIAAAVALVDDDNSTVIAGLVDPDLFDEPYDDIVARAVEHRRKFSRPPMANHIDDVFAHILEDRDHKQYSLYQSVISRLVAQSRGLDTAYTLSVIADFTHRRLYRSYLAQAVDRYQKDGPTTLDDVDAIMREALRVRERKSDLGFTLAEDRALGFLDRSEGDYCKIGIEELDSHGVHPVKRELLAFLSAPNRGKSMAMTHFGKYGLLKGWKVLHYTLENSDDMTSQRYHQALFSGVIREADYRYTAFEETKDDNTPRLYNRRLKPEFVLSRRDEAAAFLAQKRKDFRRKLDNLRIRRPSQRMSFDDLQRDLDQLKLVHRFEPDMLIVDYPQLMKLDRASRGQQDYSALDDLITNLRACAVERDFALICPQQGTRSSHSAKNVSSQHGAGTVGMMNIADNLITYSQTVAEEQHGLARLFAQKVRNDRARFTVLITQHYPSGQFCMDSWLMTKAVRGAVEAYTGDSPSRKKNADDDEDDGDIEDAKE